MVDSRRRWGCSDRRRGGADRRPDEGGHRGAAAPQPERWGPTAAGIVAAAPLTALIGLLLVDSDLGTEASTEMALRMGGYVPAQIGIAVVVVTLVARAGYTPALLVGVVAYGVPASASARLPLGLALAASVVLLLAGQRLVRTPALPDESQPES